MGKPRRCQRTVILSPLNYVKLTEKMLPSYCECWRQIPTDIIINLLCSFGEFASAFNSSFQSTVVRGHQP